MRSLPAFLSALLLAAVSTLATQTMAEPVLLNVSYDVTRELFKDINPAFAAQWKKDSGETVTIKQSHGGSSSQARAVAEGLEASVVTMNQSNDIDLLVQRGLVAKDWPTRFPDHAAPFYSTMVFVTRKGNPKGIQRWEDLAKPGVQAVIPNPKTSGNGRYTYLAAWGAALKHGAGEAGARQLVTRIFANVPVLDAGGRAATTSFTQRGIGDVLVTFENEALLARQEFGDKFEIVYPDISILAESPVAVVDRVAEQRGVKKEATAYLQFLYSDAGQDIAARHYFRPRNDAVLKKYAANFHPVALFTVDELFGGWSKAQHVHFDEGGEFDKIILGHN
jgi:sulfate transport system substrate-binding protein